MSATYAGVADWVDDITIPDDGDAAAMAIMGAALEGLADRTAQFVSPKIRALGSIPFSSSGGDISKGAGDYNFDSVTATAFGDDAKWSLNDLLCHGATLASIAVIFIPDNGPRGALPATKPTISLVRWSVVAGDAPAVVEVIGSQAYVPVDITDYENGEFKQVEKTGLAHVVDCETYTYQLIVSDEAGANAANGNVYFAMRLTYA